jgi:hypothetical protein
MTLVLLHFTASNVCGNVLSRASSIGWLVGCSDWDLAEIGVVFLWPPLAGDIVAASENVTFDHEPGRSVDDRE